MVDRLPVRKAAVQATLLGVMLGVLVTCGDGGEAVASSAVAVDMRERVVEAWDTKDERESWARLS